MNHTLYFKIPVPPENRGTTPEKKAAFENYIQNELQTKSEFQVIVWADNHQANILNLGAGKMCLSGIAGHNIKYQD